jgi:hypothetical protein
MEQQVRTPEYGCYVHGLYTEGFKFDIQGNIIIMDDNINDDIFVTAP